MRSFLLLLVLLTLLTAPKADAASLKWFKGNLHTHSLWSDGDDFPEMIAEWYKTNGYDFLAFSDHNTLQSGEKWMPMTSNARKLALQKYVQRFGTNWVQSRWGTITNKDGLVSDANWVRLKPFTEFAPLVARKDKYLLIPGEEISAQHLKAPIHLGAINLRELIPPLKGTSVVDVMEQNVDAVYDQRARTGQAMFPHVNHPNFKWAITAEELMQVRRGQLFEVYNGHAEVHNSGDNTHADTERVWDIMLTRRLAELGLPVMYGIGTDDGHHYHEWLPTRSNPGRGWVVVHARELSPTKLIEAMEAGDFYASSGVELKDIEVDSKSYRVEVKAERGVTYKIQFIGTRHGYDPRSEPTAVKPGAELGVTRRYSADIGTVLAEASGKSATYKFKGNEIYVRTKVISSRLNVAEQRGKEPIDRQVLARNPFAYQAAWTQPTVPTRESAK
ncbi:MAG TPA: hypothetical protein VK530_11675 [Candidatus Acidoferrum sp.]|nr:hypothetical protein [Candidatus Acidoferrum sp.]